MSPMDAHPETALVPFAKGELSPAELAGDDVRRLGFEIHGFFSGRNDIDTYSFRARSGTEVWFDIDNTTHNLDTVVELIDANGVVIARSDNSLAESADPSLLFVNTSRIPRNQVNPLNKSSFGIADHEFVVAFESDDVEDMVRMVEYLRSAASRPYTQLDTPILLGVLKGAHGTLADLG